MSDRNASNDIPTQPRDRLRRILASQDEESAEPVGNAPVQPAAPETPPAAPSTEPSSNDLPAEPPPGVNASQHPPAGQPEQTGGWWGEMPPFAESAPQPAAPTIPFMPPPAEGATQPTQVHAAAPVPPPPAGHIPVPPRVNETDVAATQVSPSAYARRQPGYPAQRPAPQRPPSVTRPPAYRPPSSPPPRTARSGEMGPWGCLLRLAIVFLFIGVAAVVAFSAFLVYQYFSIAATLPPVEDLRDKASQFETTRIYDSRGNLIYELTDPNAGRRTYVPIEKISPYLVAATVATEDKNFYTNPGFDLFGAFRALWQNYTAGEIVSGASTITQQLARTLLLSSEERYERTAQRKAREIVLATEITRKYSKDEILELYLNESYYSNLSYGIEAAADTYFGTTAEKLTLPQAAFLAGLPQAPGIYDIFTNREETLNRMKDVLRLMVEVSSEHNCIEVSNNVQPVCITADEAAAAYSEIEQYEFKYRENVIRFPHWVFYIRSLLEEQFDPQTIYRSGFKVYTTLDPDLQLIAERIVKEQVDSLADRNVTTGALVALRPFTGEILAMVGSADFEDKQHSGEVNMAIRPRQPGSSIKPLTYLAAFEQGWTPSTLIWDVPSEFPPSGDPNDPAEKYKPVNYDGKAHGPVTVRTALANSYNIPAVKALDFVGIWENRNAPGTGGFIPLARRLGITSLTENYYGLSLTLGGGEVTLMEMTGAYAVLANGGLRVPPVAITRIEDHTGQVIFEYKPPTGTQVIRTEHAYLISSILSDNEARTPAFGPNSVLNLPFPAAVKTGTTNDFRDNWTLGYTPDLAVGVWVGNADNSQMNNTTGLTGAAPIWSQFMQEAVMRLTNGNPTPFVRPAGITEKIICATSGTEPSEYCDVQRTELFAYDQPPRPKEEDLWQKVKIDTWTGLKASSACAEFTAEKLAMNVQDPFAIKWIKETDEGRAWAENVWTAGRDLNGPIFFSPARECRSDDPHPTIVFVGLNEGQTINTSPLDIYVVVDAPDFKEFRLDWGEGQKPDSWKALVKEETSRYTQPEKLYTWKLDKVKAGVITLRIYLYSKTGTYAEKRIHLNIQVPTPTPTATYTPTTTTTPTSTPTQTLTPTPSLTPTLTETPAPSQTPTP